MADNRKALEEALAVMPVVAILRGLKPEEAEDIGAALVNSGITAVEVPLNSPNALASIASLKSKFAADLIVGAGTVLSIDDVDAVARSGGQFVVSPNMELDVIKQTAFKGMASLPGVMTPTECFTALKAGADCLKIFPADSLGYGYIKAIRSVLPSGTRLCAVGGVDASTAADWFKAGCYAIGAGSSLYKPGDTAKTVAKKALALTNAVKKAREAGMA